MNRVLVVDDDPMMRSALARMVRRSGCTVEQVAGGTAAASAIEAAPPDLVITDMSMPDGDGFVVLAAGKRAGVPVVIVSGTGTVEVAVQAMKLGAADFLSKPFSIEQVDLVLRDNLQAERPPLPSGEGEPLGANPAFRELLERAQRVAGTTATVLITGETGTGKELVARWIHATGKRKKGPFVPVNVGALAETLIESELFGHEKGSFTGATHAHRGRFQLADGGTLFLDEIGDMPLALQVKLLRAVQDHAVEVVGRDSAPVKVDARIVAATHRNLEDLVAEGRFREDLYFRLNVVPIHMPPLRERREDIPILARHFLAEAARDYERDVTELAPALLDALSAYRWPGNIRELDNAIHQMVALATRPTLTTSDLPERIRKPRPSHAAAPTVLLPEDGVDCADLLQKIEWSLIDQALVRCDNKRSQAADLLHMKRTTLVEKLKRRGDPDGEPGAETA